MTGIAMLDAQTMRRKEEQRTWRYALEQRRDVGGADDVHAAAIQVRREAQARQRRIP